MNKKNNNNNKGKKNNANMKVIGICTIAAIVIIVGVIVSINNNNKIVRKYFGEKITVEDNTSLDNIAEKLMVKNLEALKDSSFEKYKDPESTEEYTSNLRIHDYKVLNTMAVKSKKNENIIYAYCDYTFKPYDMETYLVGGGSADGDWKTDSRFIEIEKKGKDYILNSYGTGPSEEMVDEAFPVKVTGIWEK